MNETLTILFTHGVSARSALFMSDISLLKSCYGNAKYTSKQAFIHELPHSCCHSAPVFMLTGLQNPQASAHDPSATVLAQGQKVTHPHPPNRSKMVVWSVACVWHHQLIDEPRSDKLLLGMCASRVNSEPWDSSHMTT